MTHKTYFARTHIAIALAVVVCLPLLAWLWRQTSTIEWIGALVTTLAILGLAIWADNERAERTHRLNVWRANDAAVETREKGETVDKHADRQSSRMQMPNPEDTK